MVVGKVRSTRKLRAWMVEQVNSGKYPGVVWDDEDKTMFRIPWKHAGKQDFRKDEDAAIFKAWAQYKGKLTDEELNNPASWKTRLRCALNKSPEFSEVNERAQLDISEPYKVYRLVPVNEQSEYGPPGTHHLKVCYTPPIFKHKILNNKYVYGNLYFHKSIHTFPSVVQRWMRSHWMSGSRRLSHLLKQVTTKHRLSGPNPSLNPVSLSFFPGTDSFRVVVQYLGQEVVRQQVCSSDVRIQYLRSPLCPPSSVPQGAQFPRVPLPDPGLSLGHGEELAALHTLLPFMEKGILLTSTKRGVYGKRFCQGRVFWTGPHSEQGLHKMERNTEPVLLFCKETFKQRECKHRESGLKQRD
ncbi:hypothetical protein NQD34_014702 [Periophthalmus magnuspinnatus]|nr:hypothetical protein NQD34_014702 [Periophthalmus magnuspinnatus]